jgi:hypothetical protein
MPLLRAEGGEEEPRVCLVATEDGRPTEAEAMILPFYRGYALFIEFIRGV